MIGGRYSLDREIGRGGMGAVWAGTDHTLGRTVALKRVGSAPGGADVDVRRAEREARLAARLNHPHVVAVFDLVDDDSVPGQQWMVMEHVEGTDLSQIVKANGALPPDQVAPILAQAADALAAAHAAGIVHRDVKPSNILVATDGHVKLTDFGIARTEADAALTQTGLVTGSPAYLAPEVATGRSATEASDVWSLGATLCHALTGRPPYEVGEGQSGVMGALYRIVHDDPPRPEAAGWLAPLVAATMVKDPAQRWSAAAARDFLQAGPEGAAAHTVTRTVTMDAVPPATVTTPLAAAPAPPPPPPTARPTAPPPSPPPSPTLSRARSRRPAGWLPVALALLAIVAVTAIAFAVGLQSDDEAPPTGSGAGASPSPSPSATTSAPTRPERPTEAAMETFVADYLDLAVRDPEAAFELLTPRFQDESGGLSGYLDFWGEVTNTRLDSFSGDPETLVVRYTYTRNERGSGPQVDDVQLQLEQAEDGSLLIAGEA